MSEQGDSRGILRALVDKVRSKGRAKVAFDWQLTNDAYQELNQADLQRRTAEITSREDLREFYRGELMGMHVFEGTVDVRDYLHEGGATPVQVRLLIARDRPLPRVGYDNPQHAAYSKKNRSIFATMVFNAAANAFGGLSFGRFEPDGYISYPTETAAINQLLNQYNAVNFDSNSYPLTIMDAHGSVDDTGQHITQTASRESYPTARLLDTIATSFAPPVTKPPVLLGLCNEIGGKSAQLSHPNFMLIYIAGLAGQGFVPTGTMRVSV